MPHARTTRNRALTASAALTCALLSGLLAAPPAPAADAAATAAISADPAQTIDNIGASGAWWVNDLQNFSPEKRAEVARLLFSAEGLDLSAYRYNIGGGGTGVTTPARAPEDFRNDDGSYDWSRDEGGREFLARAAQYGVEDLIGFVNSAPAEWKTNGKSCGGHLKAENEGDFAGYIADVTDHFGEQGIKLDHISPFNEPTNSFAECGQEGMLVDVGQRDDIVRALGTEQERRGQRTGIIADESSSTDGFNSEVPQWLSQPGTARHVSKLAHHTYNNPSDASLTQLRETAASFGKDAWATEICCFGKGSTGWNKEYDPTIDNALLMSRIMYKDFATAQDSAFHWWVALSDKIGSDPEAKNDDGWNDGLIYYDPEYASNGSEKLYMTKRYYALGQYSKFVRPGAKAHPVSGAPAGVEATAYRQQGKWVVVVNNHNSGATSLDLSFGDGVDVTAERAVRTSADENWADAPLPETSGAKATADLAPRSITTYVFDRS
ncbi:glycoside hydrolase family 30 protein [Streptomyces sp. NPDC002851]